MGLKLNLGCGSKMLRGYVNVDIVPGVDVRWDLESFPWPWENDSVSEIRLSHVLEHLGANPAVFIGVMKEIYRVCESDAKVFVAVPHPRHDNFIGDPTHVRPVTPATLEMFSKKLNLLWQRLRASNTPLTLRHDVDFEITSVNYTLDEPYSSDFKTGKLSSNDLIDLLKKYNNVASEIRMQLKVIKDPVTP